METLKGLLVGLGWEALLKLGLIIVDAAREIAATEGLSTEAFASKRGELEGARGREVDEALADLRGVLK